jgi:hypothetical protein
MPITESQLQKVQEIFLEQARAHFPPSVQFKEANASVTTDPYDEEWIRIELLYTARDPILDGDLMNTLHRRTDEPMTASGLTDLTMVHYVDINDPTRLRHGKGPLTP